jgi:serine/threonine protein kinase
MFMSQQTFRVSVTKIGGYDILSKIGMGGTGTVYKGRDVLTGNIVAVKVLGGEVARHPVARMRFAQECKVAQKLDHPHMVHVIDYGLDGTKPYLVMEYVNGESLGDRIGREGRISEFEAVRLISQVGKALHWAHQRKIIHRDVKPDNILIGADGTAKLSDLGLVKDLDGEYQLTQGAQMLGTPHYMAPEQFEDARDVDAVSDLYSLAGTLYMAVTGVAPFVTQSSKALGTICRKKLGNDVKRPREINPELSERVEAAILRGLRADPKERFASVLELLEAIKQPAAEPVHASGKAEESAGKNRRAKKRFASRRSTQCRPVQRVIDEAWSGRMIDISQTGVCLELNRRFETGALLTLMLEGEKAKRRSLVVHVRWVKHCGARTWQMGCQFDQALCEFEVNELR